MATVIITNKHNVVPAYVVVQIERGKKGGKITFKAVECSAVAFIPNENILANKKRVVLISKNGKTDVQVDKNAPLGEHPYAMFCVEANDFAVGRSHPVIIIDEDD